MRQSKKDNEHRYGFARRFVTWCGAHPIPAAVGIVGATLIAILSLAQSFDWLSHKLWPDRPRVMDFKPYRPEQVQHGVRFAVTIENPLDRSLIVSEASFRAEPFPPEGAYANAIELLVPAASYEVPISCAPGKRTVRLNPPLKVGPKDLGVVVFKAPPGQYACLLYVSLKTNQGSTAEQKAESL